MVEIGGNHVAVLGISAQRLTRVRKLARAVVQKNSVWPDLDRLHDVQIAVAVDIGQIGADGAAGRNGQELPAVAELPCPIIQEHLAANAIARRNDVRPAVAVHVADGDVIGIAGCQRLAAVGEIAVAIIHKYPTWGIGRDTGIALNEIKVAIAIKIGQNRRAGVARSGRSQRLPTVGKDTRAIVQKDMTWCVSLARDDVGSSVAVHIADGRCIERAAEVLSRIGEDASTIVQPQ